MSRANVGRISVDVATQKVVVIVDPAIVALTRALLPPALKSVLRPQKYPPHITLVRGEWPSVVVGPPPDRLEWAMLDAKRVTFFYDPSPVIGETYAWLRVFSPELRAYRTRLGLASSSELTRPPDGEDCFHITIGNQKP